MSEFSIPGFVAHLAAIAAEMHEVEHHALERAAVIVETEAKDAVGHYQQESGPFAAWDPLTDATMKDRVRKGFPADEPELRTGDLRDSVEHTVQGHEAHVGSDSDVMVFQELGTSKMPARSILGGAAFRKAEEAAHEIGRDVHAALIGEAVGKLAIS